MSTATNKIVTTDKLSDGELAALVAIKVMGLNVLGVATCTHIDGEWDVNVTWSPDSHWAHQEPIYLPSDHSMPCERCAEPENDMNGKFQGYSEMCLRVVPSYSTDIASAMLVVEKMRSDGWAVEIGDSGTKFWTVEFYKQPGLRVEANGVGERESLAHAICEAAIEAMTSGGQGE